MPDNEIAAFTPPGSPGTLAIWAVQLPNGSTALRADAQVTWTIPRPASETIPSGAHLLRITVHDRHRNSRDPESESLALIERLPWKITSLRQIEGVVALLNKLQLVQPRHRLCPLERGGDISVELTFYASPSATPVAAADIQPVGCPGRVSLTIGGCLSHDSKEDGP